MVGIRYRDTLSNKLLVNLTCLFVCYSQNITYHLIYNVCEYWITITLFYIPIHIYIEREFVPYHVFFFQFSPTCIFKIYYLSRWTFFNVLFYYALRQYCVIYMYYEEWKKSKCIIVYCYILKLFSFFFRWKFFDCIFFKWIKKVKVNVFFINSFRF